MSLVFSTRDDWLQWRHKGIGSSDAAVIMGDTTYKTRHQLWLEKREPVYIEPPSKWAMDQGKKLEPIARDKFNFWCQENDIAEGQIFESRNVQHPQHSFLRASLDAAVGVERVTAFGEIKFQGKFDFIYYGVPDKNFWQIQHQFLVTGALAGFFIGINRQHNIKVFDTIPDSQAIADYFREAEKFWSCVETDTPPGEVF